MRIHNLLIASALAGLMANATPARALEVNAPVHHAHHVMKPHKHAKKNGSEKHLAITKDGRTRTAGGTVSKELMGKSARSSSKGISGRRFSKNHVKSSNASSNHKKSGRSAKSTSKKYQ